MSREFAARIEELASRGVIFAVATVVDSEGSTSSKTGAKSVIGEDGEILWTTIFGGCVESAVVQAAKEVLREERPKLVKIRMTDELGVGGGGKDVIGVGMPCGGTMDVYVEPYLPKPQLLVVGDGQLPRVVARLAKILGFRVVISNVLSDEEFPDADMIVETVEDHSWADPGRRTYAVVASQLQTDDRIVKEILDVGAEYIALIASRNRAEIVLRYLMEKGVPDEELKKIRSPAGLDIGGREAEEIALSVMAEILKVMRGGSGAPLTEVKGPRLEQIKQKRRAEADSS